MLWLALHLPQLSLDIIQRSATARTTPADTLPPLAICDRFYVVMANHRARCGGIRPGMKRASAQALMPDVTLIDHDPVREQQALHTLAAWALQFTPSVGFAPIALPATARPRKQSGHPGQPPQPEPGQAGLVLEIEPSLKYFGGLSALLSQIQSGLHALGYQACAGLAPTPGAAWLLAQHAPCSPAQAEQQPVQSLTHLPQRLASLPVELLASAAGQGAALNAIGAKTLGDLLELPRAGLARRFGKALLIEVDCALGSQAQPVACFQAPATFHAKLELLADIEQADVLLFAATRLLTELTGWLSARQAAIRRFDLITRHEQAPVTAITVRLNDASRDLDRLTGLLRERLNVLQLRAPVHTIELHCDQVQPMAASSQQLFANAADTRESLGRLLERLQVRLGRNQVQRLYLAQDHRPEAAYQIRIIDNLDQLGKPENDSHAAPSKPAAVAAEPITHNGIPILTDTLFAADTGPLPRPLWLLRQPQPLRERNGRPWLHSKLNLMAGPERIETGWWDSHLVQRDYFVAEDDAHNLYWIYRERATNPGHGWYVHGRFG